MIVQVRTVHDEAAIVAASISPDHTDEMTTSVEENIVDTTISRNEIGSLQATLDDYLVNLIVAETTSTRTEIETMTSTEHTETDQ